MSENTKPALHLKWIEKHSKNDQIHITKFIIDIFLLSTDIALLGMSIRDIQ